MALGISRVQTINGSTRTDFDYSLSIAEQINKTVICGRSAKHTNLPMLYLTTYHQSISLHFYPAL